MADQDNRNTDISYWSLHERFWALRGRAIAEYSQIETTLCFLLSSFSGMQMTFASSVFFSVTSSRDVATMLNKLMKKRHGETYKVFWTTLKREIQELTHLRNKIVHWHIVQFSRADGAGGISLMQTDVYNLNNVSETTMDSVQLADFIDRCSFIWRLCFEFHRFLDPRMAAYMGDEETLRTWRDIFQSRVVYPPPSTHPLFPTYKVPETRLPPSPPSPQSQGGPV